MASINKRMRQRPNKDTWSHRRSLTHSIASCSRQRCGAAGHELLWRNGRRARSPTELTSSSVSARTTVFVLMHMCLICYCDMDLRQTVSFRLCWLFSSRFSSLLFSFAPPHSIRPPPHPPHPFDCCAHTHARTHTPLDQRAIAAHATRIHSIRSRLLRGRFIARTYARIALGADRPSPSASSPSPCWRTCGRLSSSADRAPLLWEERELTHSPLADADAVSIAARPSPSASASARPIHPLSLR